MTADAADSWAERPGVADARDAQAPPELARQAAEAIAHRSRVERHDIALVLGSGWAGAAELIGDCVARIPAGEVPGFTPPAVPGHSGEHQSVRISGTNRHALVLGARTHLYQGRGVAAVAHGIRTAAAAGCRTVLLTNGCGGLNPQWGPGSTVLISDHINLTTESPLVGATFVDLTDLYSARLRRLAREVDPWLPDGVYVQFRGPHFETPAEVRMAGVLGGDLVGMSTALEAIAAREVGMDVLGLSLVTNLAAGIGGQPLSHQEVLEAGQQAGPRIAELLARIVARIAADLDSPAPPD